jgi:hypothetical protein
MDDIATLSTIVATISIVIGVIFTVLELRHLRRTRKTEIIMRIYDRFSSREMVEAMNKVGNITYENLDEFRKKYGFTEVTMIAVLFEGLGVLLEQNLIEINLVDRLFGSTLDSLWKRMKPVIYAMREAIDEPYFFSHFEFLINRLSSYRKGT